MNIFHITFYCIFPFICISINFCLILVYCTYKMLQIKTPANIFGQKKKGRKREKGENERDRERERNRAIKMGIL